MKKIIIILSVCVILAVIALIGLNFLKIGPFADDTKVNSGQALIPLKLLSFFDSVNITLGLPLIRTSPGHGSAIELAKKGNANSKSYLKAIILADNLVNSKSVFTNQKNNE